LIEAAKKATFAGIRMARAGKRIGDVAAAIEASAAKSGVRLFEGLVGHGVGRDLHEGPPVFVKGEAGVGQAIVPGMVFTIEPVVTFGTPSYYTGEDGFSLITEDGQWASVFEHTVAVFSDRTEILTRLPKQMKEKPSLSHQEPFGA
jgi:methionyl aminopeptidase